MFVSRWQWALTQLENNGNSGARKKNDDAWGIDDRIFVNQCLSGWKDRKKRAADLKQHLLDEYFENMLQQKRQEARALKAKHAKETQHKRNTNKLQRFKMLLDAKRLANERHATLHKKLAIGGVGAQKLCR